MVKSPLRCAIYTRKSTEEGLEQDYNSLHAQRDACEAYIKSQAGEGWRSLKTAYDDGGISGGTMERPGLKRLLDDIAARKVDVVVVYKVDRLTRALGDFARIVEVFDKHGVSFVSVTQAFNTTTSMGRLTLNVLLSFAQFEREVTGERIRDKIAQSKAKGLWMGGRPPLGYDPDGRALRVNLTEAELVRHIFARYLALGSVGLLWRELTAENRLSKRWTTRAGREMGGQPFDRGAISHLLRNPVYLGMIRHKTEVHQGPHPPIIDQQTFDRVQRLLDARSVRRAGQKGRACDSGALLKGKIFDAAGVAMSPTTGRGKSGRTFRYYVSSDLQRGRPTSDQAGIIRRVPALAIETLIRQELATLLPHHADLDALIARVEVRSQTLHIGILPDPLAATKRETALVLEDASRRLPQGRALSQEGPLWWLRIERRLKFRGGRKSFSPEGVRPVRYDAALIKAVRRAHQLLEACQDENGAVSRAPADAYDRILVRLAFLSPALQASIIEGRQGEGLNLETFKKARCLCPGTIKNSCTHPAEL